MQICWTCSARGSLWTLSTSALTKYNVQLTERKATSSELRLVSKTNLFGNGRIISNLETGKGRVFSPRVPLDLSTIGSIEPRIHRPLDLSTIGSIEPRIHRTLDLSTIGSIEPRIHRTFDLSTHGSIKHWIYRLLDLSTLESIELGSIERWFHRTLDLSNLGSITYWIYRTLAPSNLGSIEPRIHWSLDLLILHCWFHRNVWDEHCLYGLKSIIQLDCCNFACEFHLFEFWILWSPNPEYAL